MEQGLSDIFEARALKEVIVASILLWGCNIGKSARTQRGINLCRKQSYAKVPGGQNRSFESGFMFVVRKSSKYSLPQLGGAELERKLVLEYRSSRLC